MSLHTKEPYITDPKIITSELSHRVTVEGHNLSIEIYKLEGANEWSLVVVDEKGVSTVWMTRSTLIKQH